MRAGRMRLIVGVAAGVLILVFLATAAFLFYRIQQFRTATRELEMRKRSLEALYKKTPFPTEENVAREQANLQGLGQEYARFVALLRAGEPEARQLIPATFMSHFFDTRRQLTEQARVHGVTLPKDFSFGFTSYVAQGVPPKPEYVPGLARQLATIARLCEILYAARVTEIRNIVRDEFDHPAASAPAAGSGRRRPGAETPSEPPPDAPGAGAPTGDGLVEKDHFVIELRAPEATVLDLLNRFARERMFIVVTSVRVTSEETMATAMAKASAAAAAPEGDGTPAAEVTAKDERIVSGTEKPLNARIELDVCRFPEQKATDKGTGP